jgi:hypothetical protein
MLISCQLNNEEPVSWDTVKQTRRHKGFTYPWYKWRALSSGLQILITSAVRALECCYTPPSSGIYLRVIRIWTDFSEEHITSIFRVENEAGKKPARSRWLGNYSWVRHQFDVSGYLHAPAALHQLKIASLHGVIPQEIELLITTSVRALECCYTPPSSYMNRRFGGTYHLHLQGRKWGGQETSV